MSENPSSCPGGTRFYDTGGFTLVEVLVAFAAMALLISVLFRGVVTLRAGSLAFDDHTHREFLARAVLDDTLARRDLAPGTYRGIREGVTWALLARSIDLSAQLPSPPPDEVLSGVPGQAQGTAPTPAKKDAAPEWALQRLTIRVGSKGKPLEVETIRLIKVEGSL